LPFFVILVLILVAVLITVIVTALTHISLLVAVTAFHLVDVVFDVGGTTTVAARVWVDLLNIDTVVGVVNDITGARDIACDSSSLFGDSWRWG
jgi:hypothetical protein